MHLIERDENIRLLRIDVEQQKQSLLKQQQQFTDLLDENKNLTETIQKLQSDLKENNQLLFEKSKQADDLDRQLQILTNEYREKSQTNDFQKENEELQQKLQQQTTESEEKIQVSLFLSHSYSILSFFFFIDSQRKTPKNDRIINSYEKRITRKNSTTKTKFNRS